MSARYPFACLGYAVAGYGWAMTNDRENAEPDAPPDPMAPGRSLDDSTDDDVEPNEPA
jgi:hypothetical protein